MATAVDALRGANWQRSGGKGSRPKPIPRPGSHRHVRHGHTSRPAHEVRDYLARFKPQDPPADGR